jgi:hypothetical protein
MNLRDIFSCRSRYLNAYETTGLLQITSEKMESPTRIVPQDSGNTQKALFDFKILLFSPRQQEPWLS